MKAAVEGWFTLDPENPALLGTRCRACGTWFFPREERSCRNPACGATDLDEVPLSRRGRVWSYTVNHYAPPAPYVAADPFEPYGIAAVELDEEKLVVLGQFAGDAGELRVGLPVELVLDTLFDDQVVWKWRAVPDGA